MAALTVNGADRFSRPLTAVMFFAAIRHLLVQVIMISGWSSLNPTEP